MKVLGMVMVIISLTLNVWADRSIHGQMRNLLKPLYEKGYITFNKKELKYEMA